MPDETTYDFACGDIMDGCAATFTGTTDEVFAAVAEHAREAHGIEHVSPEVAAAVEARLQPVA